MNIIGDYHTHTIYSHGKGTIRDNVEEAFKKGLKEIAICDHGPGHFTYGIKREDIKKMRKEIDELNKEFQPKGLKILLGVEANIIRYDGTIDVDDEIIEFLDILLLGYHFGALPGTFKDGYKLYILNFLSKVIPKVRKNVMEMNTLALIKAMDRYPIDIITHPGSKVYVDIRRLARKAKEKDIALEINSSHSHLTVEEIELALEEDVYFYINSDAHSPENVGNLENGIERALKGKVPVDRIKNIVE
ncbi:PHP domain-containing protein [Anaerosalibacter bizertensis]|uniref:PHP domain-containing protein n=1 Tax=Anaerosalibacter bizertensis TaxID=932217 RepID=A0A9Q4A9V1_9FIRM|nr:PHP domain-containing protein [Anaerosalibacter bizertensis]MBV1816536.1 PHP domain-containing protein [Bacteroidales bacterium MSK.15.36]MBU5294558.1 PHP domain-containing protein [Anaerosalibacter bizertensis]MCB5559379.1 PHP domain-containing protein [Anaerosalibacter bizertensis]MCG4563923.1 PHP domain-containing protein [Anaerosalibacter bizertensis]MCG4581539.1 PHP domain-containing protein [Anaerosalibacter bizertensis]